jgi:NADH-quinone oxidoreductase subunit I
MAGLQILKGMGITFKHFVETYLDDLRKGKNRYNTSKGINYRSSGEVQGLFTVQYPEEKLPVPEEFRYLPFLVYDEGSQGDHALRCTSCGICAKVCPPQCIWIVRTVDPVTGKPVPAPAEFVIDTDICMNCGLCAEYCPFDAIKMDHDYEIASVERASHRYNKEQLAKPASYYATIRPANAAREDKIRQEKEAAKNAAKTTAVSN